METIRQRARKAGWLYLATSLVGIVGLVYVPGKLFVTHDATATADHIRASESLLRLGMASDLVSQVMWIFVVFALYRLFLEVDRHQAQLLLILGALVSVPIMFLNELNLVAALALAKGGGYLAPFPQPQLDALCYLFVRMHGGGITVASIFWGLWLFPFGVLAIRSGFIPRLLGWLLILAGVAWVADASTFVLFPGYSDVVGHIAEFMRKGELLMILWLMILGASGPRANSAAGDAH